MHMEWVGVHKVFSHGYSLNTKYVPRSTVVDEWLDNSVTVRLLMEHVYIALHWLPNRL